VELSGAHYQYDEVFKPLYYLILKVVEDQKAHPEKYAPPMRVDIHGNTIRPKKNDTVPATSGSCCS
jgi:hypothetical protein